MLYHFIAVFCILQHPPGLANSLIRYIAVHLNYRKAFGLNVHRVDRIRIYHNRPAKIDGLKKSIAETLKARGIGDQISMGVDIFQGVYLPAVLRQASLFIDDIGYKIGVDFHKLGVFSNPELVVMPFITGCMGNDQFGFCSQTVNQFYCVFDTFALDHSCRLQN